MMLGNLTIEQIEKRTGIDFPAEIREFMASSHQPRAQGVKGGQWHCFDIPFNLLCGDIETAQKIYDSIKNKASECKEPLEFSVQS